MVAQTSTQIQREAPFIEDARRRLLDTIFATGTYTQADKDAGQIPPGFDVGDKRQGLADMRMPIAKRGIAEFAPTEAAAFSEATRQLGIDPTTGQRTGVASG